MKRTTLTQGVVFAIATWLLAAPASARQGETRLTDKAVVQIIESVEKGRNTFESKIDDKVKSSILRSPRPHGTEFIKCCVDQNSPGFEAPSTKRKPRPVAWTGFSN